MKRLFQIFAALALAAAGYFLWVWTHPTPEKAIRKQMQKLAETLASKPNEGNIARVAGINKTLSFFTSDIYISGEGVPQISESIQGRGELQQALFAARQRLVGAITFYDVNVIVGPEATNAVVNFTAVAHLASQAEPYQQDMKAQFAKIDGDWLISRVDPIVLHPTVE